MKYIDRYLNDTHYCPFCEKVRVLTDWDTCCKCGRNFTEGMDEDKLLETLKGYRELVKMLCSIADTDQVPAWAYMGVLEVRKNIKDNYDLVAGAHALKQLTEMLAEECEECDEEMMRD